MTNLRKQLDDVYKELGIIDEDSFKNSPLATLPIEERIRMVRKLVDEKRDQEKGEKRIRELQEEQAIEETASKRKAEIAAKMQERKENERKAKVAAEEKLKQKPESSPVGFVPLEDWRDQ